MKHLLSVLDAKNQLWNILDEAEAFKIGKAANQPLKGRTLAMIFEKASTRTRVSFEVAMFQLGGIGLYLSASDLQLGRGEIIEDTARAMGRYVDGVMIRAKKHEDVLKFANFSNVPVINGLTNLEHPCQALTDIFTVKERKGNLNVQMAFLGDGNNVCNSLLLIAPLVGMDITVACPYGYEPDSSILKKAIKLASLTGSRIEITNNVSEAVNGADVIYTDVWVSMGDEDEEAQRIKDFRDFQVNQKILKMADKEAIVMHCLPAIRGQEITEEVLNGPQSSVWDQAENRLHVQKAILNNLLGKG
jgi:ornithine carbamoyltransferase